jgi:electron transfer flavoprotein alpha/beta subunit
MLAYAIEEAVLIKGKTGGVVTAITIGSEDDEEGLRRRPAMGADRFRGQKAGWICHLFPLPGKVV